MGIDSFLGELRKTVVKHFGDRINFILLLGSAARGDFKEGVSDIDLIIEVKDEETKKELSSFLDREIWKLDRKHKTRIKEAIKNDVFSFLSESVKLYTPYEIFVEGEVDWKEGRINKNFGFADPFISKAIFAEKIRKEGKILYGKDIRKEVKVKITAMDRIRLLVVPYLLSIVGFVVSIFKPSLGLKLAVKALFYGIDDHLFFAKGKVGKNKELKIKQLKRLMKNYSTRLIREAILIKYNFDVIEREWIYFDKVFFCLETIFNILYNTLVSVFYYVRSVLFKKNSGGWI